MTAKPRGKNKSSTKQTPGLAISRPVEDGYESFLGEVSLLLTEARKQAARAVNTVLVATYWKIGRRIVEFEQGGKGRAGYGEQLMERLSQALTEKFGKGFSRQNLQSMRQFYASYPPEQIRQTMSGKSVPLEKSETPSRIFSMKDLTAAFPLSWSHYVLLTRRCRFHERAKRMKEGVQ
jgi:hypothetical protein